MSTAATDQNWAILPYNAKRFNGCYLVSNFLGNWDFVTLQEFSQIERLDLDEQSSAFERLKARGLIMHRDNVARLLNEYRNLNSNLFTDTSLHMAVVTTRCNIACRYCHAATNSPSDMTVDTAMRIIQYLFDVRSQNVTLELRGGEPLLNWDVVKFLVENTRKFNTINKRVSICLVTNGTLLNEEKLNVLLDNDVSICIS